METICIVAIMVTIIIKMYTGGDMANLISVLAAFALAAIRLIPVMGNLSSSIGRVTFNRWYLQRTKGIRRKMHRR